jgi:hypothetical protein
VFWYPKRAIVNTTGVVVQSLKDKSSVLCQCSNTRRHSQLVVFVTTGAHPTQKRFIYVSYVSVGFTVAEKTSVNNTPKKVS